MPFRRLAPFLIITFALTWGLAAAFVLFTDPIVAVFGPLSMTNPLFLLAVYAPGIAAVTLVLLDTGLAGLGRFLKRLLIWRANPGWYLLIFFGIPLIIGVVWGLWHVPAFLLGGTPQSGWDFLPYFVGLMSVAMIMTVVFNASGGSLLLAVLMHFQLNNPLLPDGQPLDPLFFLAVATGIVWWNRPAVFGARGVTTVVPD